MDEQEEEEGLLLVDGNSNSNSNRGGGANSSCRSSSKHGHVGGGVRRKKIDWASDLPLDVWACVAREVPLGDRARMACACKTLYATVGIVANRALHNTILRIPFDHRLRDAVVRANAIWAVRRFHPERALLTRSRNMLMAYEHCRSLASLLYPQLTRSVGMEKFMGESSSSPSAPLPPDDPLVAHFDSPHSSCRTSAPGPFPSLHVKLDGPRHATRVLPNAVRRGFVRVWSLFVVAGAGGAPLYLSADSLGYCGSAVSMADTGIDGPARIRVDLCKRTRGLAFTAVRCDVSGNSMGSSPLPLPQTFAFVHAPSARRIETDGGVGTRIDVSAGVPMSLLDRIGRIFRHFGVDALDEMNAHCTNDAGRCIFCDAGDRIACVAEDDEPLPYCDSCVTRNNRPPALFRFLTREGSVDGDDGDAASLNDNE